MDSGSSESNVLPQQQVSLQVKGKHPEQLPGKKVKKHTKSSNGSSLVQPFICLLLSTSVLVVFLFVYTDLIPWHLTHRAVDRISKQFGYYEPAYALVIDAGSTASRVHAFTFHKAFLDGHLVLDKSFFYEVEPGLSSFANAPEKGANTIRQLVDRAKSEIPESYWSNTSVVLKATAGLRLLPQKSADDLLEAVRRYFKTLPFRSDENAVTIMDGKDEGIFSWFTVNFLQNLLNGKGDHTVAALDLGGGSTQVTFSPSTPSMLSQKEHISEVKLAQGGSIRVFTNSYLGLGLNAARKDILVGQQNSSDIRSVCVNGVVKEAKWLYGGVEYSVSGPEVSPRRRVSSTASPKGAQAGDGEEVPVVDVAKCSTLVRAYVKARARPLDELKTKRINAFSYYYDRASEAGLIDRSKGGSILVEDYKKSAQEVCNTADADQPFLCLDLTFISVLLEEGFGLRPNTRLNLFKKIQGHEISWALGVAFDTFK